MTSIKFVNTQAPRGSPSAQHSRSGSFPAFTSTSLPNVGATSLPYDMDLDHQMRMFMAEKRAHEVHSRQGSDTASPTPQTTSPPRRLIKTSMRFVTPPLGGRGEPSSAIDPSVTSHAMFGRASAKAELRSLNKSSPTLSHKPSFSASGSPFESLPAHDCSRSKNGRFENPWTVRGPVPPPSDVFWASSSPSVSPLPNPNSRPLTHVESPLLPPLPSISLLNRSNSPIKRENSPSRIVPPPLTPTGVAAKTGLPPPPVSPSMLSVKPRCSPPCARKTPTSRTSDVLDTVYSIYNKLPSSRDRGSSSEDFVSRLATKIVPRRNTPSPSPPTINPPQPVNQFKELPPPPPLPPKHRPLHSIPPVIPLVELPGSLPPSPPQARSLGSRSPSGPRSTGSRSPGKQRRSPKQLRSPPPSQQSEDLYSRLPLPPVPTPPPSKPTLPLSSLSPLSIPPTSSPLSLNRHRMTGDFEMDPGYAGELVEWFENFYQSSGSALSSPSSSASSPRTPNSDRAAPFLPSPIKGSRSSNQDPSIVITSGQESPVTGRRGFLLPSSPLSPPLPLPLPRLEPSCLSPFTLPNSGMRVPRRKPVPVSLYSVASSVGDAFRFDGYQSTTTSSNSSPRSEKGEDQRLQEEIEHILNNAVIFDDEDAGRAEEEGKRRTRYIAGRNSGIEGDVIFCLKASEI